MAIVSVSKNVNAPVEVLWASWDDFANIYKFHPDLKKSYLLGKKQTTGMGALRQCDFMDGKTFLKEKIVGYEPNKQLVLDIYDNNAPIKRALVTFDFTRIDATHSKIKMTFDFKPKMGLLGVLLIPLMKMQFNKGLNNLIGGNAKYVEELYQAAAA